MIISSAIKTYMRMYWEFVSEHVYFIDRKRNCGFHPTGFPTKAAIFKMYKYIGKAQGLGTQCNALLFDQSE